MTSDIKRLLLIIELQLDWGDPAAWQSRDFEILSQFIFDKTKVSLSESTLRRVWGRVEYKHLPSATTLDTLAKFAGFESWRGFLKKHSNETPIKSPPNKLIESPKPWVKTAWTAALLIIVVLAGFRVIKSFLTEKKTVNYKFSSQRLTGGIPNSVIFDYDAAGSTTDSVFIQQSWDPRTKTAVKRAGHQFTSVYFEPGFYQAKLLVGKTIVKEHKLMIPSEGWLGLIEDKPIPVYLSSGDFMHKDGLSVSVNTIKQKNMSLQPKPTTVRYYNVGNFEQVAVSDFEYNAVIKNDYRVGEAACQFSTVSLITDAGPIIIPLSVKGCVSELNLFSVDWVILGKTANLSGFGVDVSNWVKVSCRSTAKTIRYYVNDKQVFEFKLPAREVKIVGLAFSFQGTGSVKNIELKGAGKTVFKGF
ncbi:hypothetical protein [Mucilaginibacter sp.]|uniref:hypothetical protein n=1 Tax=Mucilaginibacter sp. TaxID=1882438 RepID=UPI0025E2CC96|nr:hypothetical protein [Mucilaginibacter sp.]